MKDGIVTYDTLFLKKFKDNVDLLNQTLKEAWLYGIRVDLSVVEKDMAPSSDDFIERKKRGSPTVSFKQIGGKLYLDLLEETREK